MDDLISRQAAIDALNDEFTITGKTNAIAVQDYIRRVNNRLRGLPSAQPEQRWIPVTERLPEETMDCLFTVYTYDSEFDSITIETKQGYVSVYDSKRYWSWEDDGFECVIENEAQTDGDNNEILEMITAWMPLPEPYRPEGGEADV